MSTNETTRPQVDESAVRADERADIARQLDMLAADGALIADWATTFDPIPLTMAEWLRALAGKIRAGDPQSRDREAAAYQRGREDAARDIEDAYDVARGTLRRAALRKAARIARGQQPAGEQR